MQQIYESRQTISLPRLVVEVNARAISPDDQSVTVILPPNTRAIDVTQNTPFEVELKNFPPGEFALVALVHGQPDRPLKDGIVVSADQTEPLIYSFTAADLVAAGVAAPSLVSLRFESSISNMFALQD